jgi:uncharacterized repeat protein (TIGR01451 family)
VTEAKLTKRKAVLCPAAKIGASHLSRALGLCLAVVAGSIWGCGGTGRGSGVSGPSLDVSISHQSSAQGATFGIYVSNVGNAPVNGPVTLTLSGTVVPSGNVVPGNGWTCNPVFGVGTTTFGSCTHPGPIPPDTGASISVSYNITTVFLSGNPVNPPTSFGLSISAQATAPGNISAGASDGVTIPLGSSLSSGISTSMNFRLTHVGSSFPAGGTGIYVLSVENAGEDESAGSLSITANLPPGFVYVSSSGTGWACGGGQIVSCTFASTVAPGTTADMMLTVAVDPSLSGAATSNWSTSLSPGMVSPLAMNDVVLVEPPESKLPQP